MNTPNKITLLRICLIPLVVFFYLATFIPWNAFIAGVLFVVAALTDFLDGYLARKNNQVTTLGKFLDAIADKMLVTSALLMIIAYPIVNAAGNVSIVKPQWLGIVCGVIILAREFAVSALRMLAASKGKVLAAEKSGKIKAAVQFVTLALYFFYAFYVVEFYSNSGIHRDLNTAFAIVLIVLLVLSTVLTVYSGVSYLYKNREVFVDEATVVVKEEQQTNCDALVKKDLIASTQQQTELDQKSADKQKTKSSKGYDELMDRAMELFWEKGWASTTMLQKHLGVGYPRASKIVDQMQQLGLISSNEGAKTRRVLVSKKDYQKFMSDKK